MIFVTLWQESVYEIDIFSNWKVMGSSVVG
jgi:hypothetical protein